MGERKIAELFNIQRRFLRSAHLERDFRDPSALDGYVVTHHIEENLSRLSKGLSENSGQRAWRITGDYGSGKSSFALLLAHILGGKDSDLPSQVRKALDLRSLRPRGLRLQPVLVTGSREPLATAVTRALGKVLEQQFDARTKFRLLQDITLAVASPGASVSDERALQFLLEANSELIARQKASGLLIILDELGKFLEFAALHPERQDIFFLQQLAEASARSSTEPLFTLGLLHQGFSAYADQLSQSAQKEWEKVAGRFDEIVFDQPLDQIAHLIAAALNVSERLFPHGTESSARSAMGTAAELGWFNAAPPTTSLVEAAPGLYPLHPSVIPVLVKLFSRFGQNERSLFSFLLSNEPFSLQSFADQEAKPNTFYRVHHLYDYAAANFGHRLSIQSYRNHWNHIDSLVRSFPSESETEIAILKTVGLLNLLNSPNLVPTEEGIILALADFNSEGAQTIRATIQRLHKDRHVLYARGKQGGYCLWSHTSVNLDAAYEEASRAVGYQKKVAAHIQDQLDARPVVARRHYIQTGNLRHFDVTYCSLQELENIATAETTSADGRIIIPLCETSEDVKAATVFARRFAGRLDTLVGITDPLASLSGLLQEVDRWTYVQRNVPELKDDRYAEEEVARQLSLAKQTLEKRIEHYAGLRQSSRIGDMSIHWFSDCEPLRIKSGTEFLELLSDICDRLYKKAPRIHNELINRRTLSSAAASARMRLIERMFEAPERRLLGMDDFKKPPEMSMYLSLLLGSRLHTEATSGKWKLGEPSQNQDPCNLLPALSHLKEKLAEKPDTRVPVTEVLDALRRPQFGVRNGILPVLLVVSLLEHQHEMALYENGTFLSQVGAEEILRLSKAPQTFELQFFKIQGIRRTVFEKLATVLGVTSRSKHKTEILDVVRPLCVFIAQLPEYTRTSEKLNLTPRAVRDAILRAREPATLLFKDLPVALDLEPFTAQATRTTPERTQEFLAFLQTALEELKLAYPMLKTRIREKILAAFEAPASTTSMQAFRDGIAERCQGIVIDMKDMDLKAFCLRMLDTNLPESDWLESIGSLVANTPPSRWKDEDEAVFVEKLTLLIQKFHRVESLYAAKGKQLAGKASLRVAITLPDGTERDRVVHLASEEELQANAEAESQFSALLGKSDRVAIAAASRLILKILQKTDHEHPRP
jgi:hypothetical protein